jgi:hypothetical protein
MTPISTKTPVRENLEFIVKLLNNIGNWCARSVLKRALRNLARYPEGFGGIPFRCNATANLSVPAETSSPVWGAAPDVFKRLMGVKKVSSIV